MAGGRRSATSPARTGVAGEGAGCGWERLPVQAARTRRRRGEGCKPAGGSLQVSPRQVASRVTNLAQTSPLRLPACLVLILSGRVSKGGAPCLPFPQRQQVTSQFAVRQLGLKNPICISLRPPFSLDRNFRASRKKPQRYSVLSAPHKYLILWGSLLGGGGVSR